MTKEELQKVKDETTSKFEQILGTAEAEKRELNEDEQKEVSRLKDEVKNVERQLADLDAAEAREVQEAEAVASIREEKEAEINTLKEELRDTKEQLITIQKQTEKMDEKNLFDSLRGLIEEGRGMIVASRADVDGDTTAMENAIPNYIEALSIVGYEPMWQRMGVSVLSGAKGTFTLPYENPIVGQKLAELALATKDATTPEGILVQPVRYTVQKQFTLETLASATDEFLRSVIADMVKGADRAITAELYAKLINYAQEVSGGAITKAGFDALMAGAEVENDGAFVANRGTFFEAKGVNIDTGSGRFLIESIGEMGKGYTYEGAPFWYSSLFDDTADKQFVIYGDLSYALVADYGQLEIIVDKYTKAGSGHVIITVNKIADVKVKNPFAFSRTPDLNPA